MQVMNILYFSLIVHTCVLCIEIEIESPFLKPFTSYYHLNLPFLYHICIYMGCDFGDYHKMDSLRNSSHSDTVTGKCVWICYGMTCILFTYLDYDNRMRTTANYNKKQTSILFSVGRKPCTRKMPLSMW